jgi:hypothetical protein
MQPRVAIRWYVGCSQQPHANHRLEQVGVDVITGLWIVALGTFAGAAWCTLGVASFVTALRRE